MNNNLQIALQLFKLRGWSVQEIPDHNGDLIKSLVVPLDENGIELWKDEYPVCTLMITPKGFLVPKYSPDVYKRLVANGIIDPNDKRPYNYIGKVRKRPF